MGATGKDPKVPLNSVTPIYNAPTIARTHPKKLKKPIPYQERESLKIFPY